MPQNKSWEINEFLTDVCDALKRLTDFEKAVKKDYDNATERQKTLYVVYHGKIMAYIWTLQQIGVISDSPDKWFKEYEKYRKTINKLWKWEDMKPQCSYL